MKDYSLVLERISTELNLLTTDTKVPSYFHYENSQLDDQSHKFYIDGYLLPRLEPYKYGSYKVRIVLHPEFPFRAPDMKLLTYIYHPAVSNNQSNPRYYGPCCVSEWRSNSHITQWIERNLNVFDRPDDSERYYQLNPAAKDLYDQNRVEYGKKVLAMIEKYSYPRANQSIISLKFALKQIIRKQLNFDSVKLNQLPLSNSLKQYLNPSLPES